MTPRIVAPVSRFLSVGDVDRSIAFYRDVLGFQASATSELISGPARLQLSREPTADDSTGDRRPRGATILLFETDDFAAMHEAVRARGGTPSEIEKVKWIKMK